MDEIKTEVDRLIELLIGSAGKPMRTSQLAALTGLSTTQVRKWVHILEERHQVRVRYNLADEEVEWIKATGPRRPGPSFSAIQSPRQLSGQPEPEELAVEMAKYAETQYRQNRRVSPSEPDAFAVPAPEPRAPMDVGEKTLDEPMTPAPRSAPRDAPHPIDAETQAGSDDLEGGALPPLPAIDEKSLRMSKTLKSKIAQARAKRDEIEKLKAEKKRLLVEVYRPLETKFEQETGTITEKLIELENHLLAIREEAAKVPNEVAQLAGEQERIVQIASEMQRIYAETDRQMAQSIQTLNAARSGAQARLAQARQAVESQHELIDQLARQSTQLEELQAGAEERIAQAQEALATQAAQIESGLDRLRQIEQMRQQANTQVQAGQQELDAQRNVLAEIEHQLGRIDEVQHWVQEHQVEYGQRMQNLRRYIDSSEEDYRKLKAASDSGYIHRYLRDLRALSESYEFELSQAQRQETNIDQRLEQTKKELTALITQAREVADTQEMHLSQSSLDTQALMQDQIEQLQAATADVLGSDADRNRIRERLRRTMRGEEEPKPPAPRASEPVPAPQKTPGESPKPRRGRPRKNEGKKH